jgi:hypothetical protein
VTVLNRQGLGITDTAEIDNIANSHAKGGCAVGRG